MQKLYFNSIKVRLELVPLFLLLVVIFYFNSIKVRLELNTMKNTSLLLLYFNSIKVRLELVLLQLSSLVPKFQFHKGAIRTKIANDFYRYSKISIP